MGPQQRDDIHGVSRRDPSTEKTSQELSPHAGRAAYQRSRSSVLRLELSGPLRRAPTDDRHEVPAEIRPSWGLGADGRPRFPSRAPEMVRYRLRSPGSKVTRLARGATPPKGGFPLSPLPPPSCS